MKNRYEAWKPFQVWLEVNRGRTFPLYLKDIIDYVQHRVDDGCGRTVPESFHIALVIEQLGRVPTDQRLSNEEVLSGHGLLNLLQKLLPQGQQRCIQLQC